MRKGTDPTIGINDDYACAYISDENWDDIISLYYGYEKTYCPDHKNQDECYEADCEKTEWCFEMKDKDGSKMVYTAKELEEYTPDIKDRMPHNYLLAGILKAMDEGILEINKAKLAGKILKEK